MRLAGLLGVGAADDLGACMPSARVRDTDFPTRAPQDRMENMWIARTVLDGLLGMEPVDQHETIRRLKQAERGTGDTSLGVGFYDARSLLAGETLEDNFGVGVDAQVLNRLRVWGRLGAVRATRELVQGCTAQGGSGNDGHLQG